jgi:hypothetical protein
MATRIKSADGLYDLSEIKTLKDLREEIELLRVSIKKDEQELEDRLHKMPHEVLKATGDAVLPAFLNRMIANGSWKILASGAGMLVNPFSKKSSVGKTILTSAKKIGFVALMKGAYNLWKNRRSNGQRPAVSLKQAKPVASIPVKKTK